MSTFLAAPLARSVLSINDNHYKVTQWGTPLESAKHVVFYFGGMPASAEEPAMHTCGAGRQDVYTNRNIHLVCIDKPGMGGSNFQYFFSIQRDWPKIVENVATQLHIPDRYGVIGVSNGGPYLMASLTHSKRVKAAAMVVGVSDNVWSSGYCTWRKPSTMFEGIFNSLPLFLTGPLNALALHAGNYYLMRLGGFESQLQDFLPLEAKPSLQTWIKDGAKNVGLGASLDCQQGLSLLYATSTKTDYSKIMQPVSLWYGLQDSTVPMKMAEWLEEQLPNSKLYKLDGGHGLYFTHTEQILDDLVFQMDKADEKANEAS